MSLRIFPATDLHLLNGTSVSLRFFAHIGDPWTDLSVVSGFAIQFNPMPGFITQAGLTITGTGVGSAVTRVFMTDPIRGINSSAPMRIAVHRELRRLFLPQAALELETDRDDRVLTVYGEFQASDGLIITADITAHPYLRYSVNVATGSPTLQVTPEGRVSSGNSPGTVEIQVSVDPTLSQPAPAVTMRITIVPAVTDRPILQRFHTGAAIRKKSILFVPDGFTSAQKTEFEILASWVGRKLLQTLSPYRHLRESFDLYTAFVPSTEEGTTIGPPIIARPHSADVGFSLPMDRDIQQGAAFLEDQMLYHLGHPATSAAQTLAAAQAQLQASLRAATHQPFVITATQLPQVLFDLWQSLRTQPPQSRVRETFFGVMIGERHHGTEAILEAVPTPPMPQWPPLDAAIFLRRGQIRTALFDERRVADLTLNDPKTAHLPAFSRFLSTLRVPGESLGFGTLWSGPSGNTPAGDSFGLVVIIARADHYSGVRQEGCLLLSLGPGIIHHTQASTVVPRLLEVVPVPRPISNADRARGFAERPIDSLMDVVAHELAHASPLGSLNDEYGGGRQAPDPTDPKAASFVEDAPNTQLLANSQAGAGPGLNMAQVKWNWERPEGAARVETIRVVGAVIEIGVTTEDALRWPALVGGRLLILRGRNLAAPAPGSIRVGTTPAIVAPQFLTFTSFNVATGTIQCGVQGPATAAQVVAAFPPGSVILVPLFSGGATVPVITAGLAAQLAIGPFSPSGPQCAAVTPPVPPNVPGYGWPGNQLDAIAAYEVGAGFDCGVIRPTGQCKMRNVVDEPNELPTDFCYVCKYAMVFTIDPAMLPAIDGEYP